MIRFTTEQRPAATPTATPVVPVMSGLIHRRVWLGDQADPCLGGNHGSYGFTAKRSARHLGRPST
jgi:hypothetical protein